MKPFQGAVFLSFNKTSSPSINVATPRSTSATRLAISISQEREGGISESDTNDSGKTQSICIFCSEENSFSSRRNFAKGIVNINSAINLNTTSQNPATHQ
jgi:hypothetical protein